MKIRKTLAFIICVAMIFTATQTTITYADDSTTPTVYVESVSATQGSRVTVYVGIRNAVDLGGLDVSVFYDSKAFTLVSADKGNFVAGASVSINTKNAGTVRESIVALDGMNGDGYLMSVCFDISENAAVKDYDITVGIGEAFDTSVPPNSVTVERTSGIITVERNEIIQRYANFYSFAEPSNSVSEGDEVHFKVFGGDVNGLASGIFEFTYDPEILEYVGYELGDELLSNTAIHSVNSRTPGLVRIVYAEIEAITEDYGQLFFDMTFRVRKNTSENTTVSFAGSSLLDENLNSMTTNGTRREISVIKKRSSLLVNWDGTQDGDRKFTVDVILTGDSNVSAGDFAVIYDTSTVSCEAVTVDGSVAADGALLVYNENISDGRVSFSYVNSNGCSKDSTLLHITFRQPNCIAGGTYFLPTGRDVVDKDLNDLELIYNFYNITMPYDMGHILVPTAAVEPTCTEDGNSAYWTCTNCGKFFSDAEGKNQIEENGWIEKALDHDYIYHSAKDPTCTEAGWYSYYTCSRCEYTTYQEIDAIGHDWGTPKYDWADDYSSVSAERVCMNDPTHVERETVNTTSEVTKTATCEENGETTYTATFTNDAFAGQTKTVDNIPATGHDWKFIDLVWTGDDENGYTAATAHYECLNDEAHNRSVSAVITKETSDATCTKPGTVTYTASVSKEAAPDGKAITDTKVVSGVPLGHDYEAANWDWSEDMSTASVTLVCKNDNSHMETVTATVTKVRTEPTCEKAGSIVYTAKVEFDGKEYTNSVKEDLAAIGHDWGAPSYTWAPDSSEVTARRICANDPTHIEEETVSTEAKVTKAATCETKGETTYTAFFTNEGFETQSKTIANIDAIGHDWGTPKYDWSDDYSSVYAERVCANDPSHIESETAYTTSEVTKTATCEENGETTYKATFTNDAFAGQTKTVDNIPATGHDWKFIDLVWTGDDENGYTAATAHYECLNDEAHNRSVSAVITKETGDATCTVAGTVTYTATISEEAAPDGKAITDTKVVSGVPLGHDYEAASWDWAEDMSTASVTLVCKNDNSHVETVNATVSRVRTEPTCEKAGNVIYTAKATYEGEEYTNSRSEEIAPLGHAYGTPSYAWADDNSTVTATRVCANDPSHVETETVSTTSEVIKKATCEAAGETEYTAIFTNSAFASQTKKVETAALGHDWNEGTVVPATCTSEGSITYTCKRDSSHIRTESIPALGHNYGEPTYVWADDNSTVTAARVCANDTSHIDSETALTVSETIKPTCETDGKIIYTATFTNEAFKSQTKEVAGEKALGHDYVVTYNWTRDEDGGYTVTAKAICKNDPTDEITETVKAVKEVLYEPAADEPGLARYTVTFGNEILGTKTREELIPELDYDVPVYEWIETDDGFAVKATVACLDDPSKSITETVPAAYEVISPAKCESDGKGIYTVAFESGLLSDQTKEVTIPATGHSWSGPEWKWTDDGSAAKATFTCANDGETTDSTAAVTAEKKSGNMVYTATVTGPDGKTYTEIKTVPVANDDILRIFGSTRYLTAFKNADKLKEELGISKFSTVVVATGMNFPDSLSGAYLANVKDAPILLISEKEAANVRSYISANLEKGGTIYILGGEGVVKDSWLSGLGSFHKKRLAGSTRYETNLEVLKEVGYNGGDILIATGLNYPDSLAGSSVAMPILLVKGNTLMPEQTAYLKGLGGKLNCYIAGGTGAVSAEMEKTLRANGTIARRFAGTDRYETSRMIAEEFFAKSDMAILAVGSNFPDGLSVGPLAAKVNAPILLTNNGAKSESSQAFTDSHGIKSGIVIGGPALISDEVAKSVLHNNTIVLYEN